MRAPRILGLVLKIGVVLYLGAAIMLFALQDRLVFPGTLLSDPIASNPAVHAQRVDFQSADRTPQVAWKIPDSTSGYWILYFHGNGSSVPHEIARYALFRELGFNVFAPEYRGYAGTPGHPSEAALAHDAVAAYGYLRDTLHVPDDHIILYGWSLGSAVAIDLAAQVPARALIAEGSPASVVAIGAKQYPWLPVRWFLTNRFESDQKIAHVSIPILFVHARHDRLVPESNGRRLYDLARAPKAFLELPAGGHNDAPSVNRATFCDGVMRFLAQQAGLTRPPTGPVPAL